MRLSEKTVAVLVCWDVVVTVIAVWVDEHVIGDAKMVVAQGLIDPVDVFFLAQASVGNAEMLVRVAVEVVLFPLARIHVLIRIV